MLKVCPKCDHPNPRATGADDETCPNCGVIYAKAKPPPPRPPHAAPRVFQPSAPAPNSGFQASRTSTYPAADTGQDRGAFVREMRGSSLYPAFRSITQLAYLLGLFLVLCLVLAALVAFIAEQWVQGAAAVAVAAVVFVLVRVSRELALMLADLSDAMVSMAASSRRR